MARRLFETGHTYIGGADVPFIVSEDMIRGELEDNGFADVRLWDAGDFGPLPFAVSGDFNTVGMATYRGASKTLDMPDELAFLHDLTPPARSSEDAPPAPVVVAPRPEAKEVPRDRWWIYSGGVAGVMVVLAGGLWLADRA